jgi:hypothetical protein
MGLLRSSRGLFVCKHRLWTLADGKSSKQYSSCPSIELFRWFPSAKLRIYFHSCKQKWRKVIFCNLYKWLTCWYNALYDEKFRKFIARYNKISKICHLSICQMSIRGILALKSLYNKKNIFIYFFYYRENLRPPQKNTPYLFSWQIDRWQIDIFELLRCRCDVDVNSIIDSRLTCLGVIWVLMCWVSDDSIFMLRLCGQSKICHLSICQTVKGVFFRVFLYLSASVLMVGRNDKLWYCSVWVSEVGMPSRQY